MKTKDKTIKVLMLKLKRDLGKNNFVTVPHWDDPYMVGLAPNKKKRQIVFISTQDFKDSKEAYYYECEMPNGPDETDYKTVDTGYSVSYTFLLKAIKKHFLK